MTQVVTSERRQVAVRGFQMLVIGIIDEYGFSNHRVFGIRTIFVDARHG